MSGDWREREKLIAASRSRIVSGGCAVTLILAAGTVAAVYGIVRGVG